MNQTLVINELPFGLNGSKGLIRSHFREQKIQKTKWIWLVKECKPKIHSGQVIIKFTRVSNRMMDYDNLGASFKFIGDALKACHVIKDDNPKIVTELLLKWVKCPKSSPEHVMIEIFDID